MTNGERDHSNSSSETEQSETIPSTTEAVASSSANNVYANSNLEVAMSEFISQIVTPHAATIPHILHLKQLLRNSRSQSIDTMDFTTSTVTAPTDHSSTQPHSVTDFTSTITTPPTDHLSTRPHSVMDFATKDAVRDFNQLPRDLSQFVGQMKNGTEHFPKFEDLSDDYKNIKTKSAFSKRKAVYQYMINYEGGLEKCITDFAFATPTWLYNNKVRNPHAYIIIQLLFWPTWNTYILLLSLYSEFPDMIGHIACACTNKGLA